MTNSQIYPYEIALHIVQQAVAKLVAWANAKLPDECQITEDSDAIKRAKCILHWPSDAEPKPLSLLFDSVKLSDSKGQSEVHYWKAEAIANEHPSIPYPQPEPPTDAELNKLKSEIKQSLNQLESYWNNLSLLTLILEKFGSHLSLGKPDVALIDMARSTAAVAAALANNPEANYLSLVAGDLSGIQKFIYTISSDGALKSLRARSFYLELLTEEIVQQLLTKLGLPRTNVIYAGGGNLYLLAPVHENIKTDVLKVQNTFNKWLLNKFQSKIFLALTVSDPFLAEDVVTDRFAEHWDSAIKTVNQQKYRKFINQIGDLLKLKNSYEQRCRVCYRDDTPNLKEVENDDGELIIQCPTCQKMSQLGRQLFKTGVVVRSRRTDIPGKLGKISFQFAHYYLFENQDNLPQLQEEETVFHINNWELKRYQFKNSVSLLLGNYGQKSEEKEPNFIRAIEMVRKAEGIKRVGYLRMDVDNLGKIFAKGLKEKTIHNLPRIAGLSRQMSYFFKVYLNSLAKDRETNFLKHRQNKIKVLEDAKCLKEEDERKNLLFIYAGGDDLFVSGTWNEVVEFAFDVYQSFRAYTGNNPDITLSGGISLADVKFPLYQAAREAEESEKAAKANGRDSLGLFGEKFKWSEWLGQKDIEVSDIETFDSEIKNYLGTGFKIELFGVLPFVQILEDPEIGYSRSFIRNLLDTANLQNQKIKEIEDEQKQEEYTDQKKDIRYYLHLPQIAYTLARLPTDVREHEKFKPVRTSLKSPYNAPYFRAIATWLELLTRKQSNDSNNDYT